MPRNPDLLAQKLGLRFIDPGLLFQALTHSSYLNENRSWPYGMNERLEFLGDAVLGLIVTEYLFTRFPKREEGDLTALRAVLVATQTLTTVAKELEIEEFLFFSKGQAKEQSRSRAYALSCAVEALIGALYVDQGLERTRTFVAKIILSRTDGFIEAQAHKDPKSELQRITQERFREIPTYRVLSEGGPDHDKRFECGVFLRGECIGKAWGPSKQEAEKEAAKGVLLVYSNPQVQ